MPRRSAGVLLHRGTGTDLEVLIVHPGGPFWARKDDGAWSIPKGEYTDDEDPWQAARREFAEELGLPVPDGQRVDLGEIRQSAGKVVTAFAVAADLDVTETHSNTVELEWPRGSGRLRDFPEVDRVEWVRLEVARVKLLAAQTVFLDRLCERLA
ncbi:MAG: NUDIX domain-containing protein [Mycobacterium sp.]